MVNCWFFEIQEMAKSQELQDIANVVEFVIVAFDFEVEEFTDKNAA